MKKLKKYLLLLLFYSLGTASFCTTCAISSSENSFNYPIVSIILGDTVNFKLNNIQNVIEVNQASWISNDTTPLPGFSIPFGGGMVLPVQLSVGIHFYVCSANALLGMKGIIFVRDPTGKIENRLEAEFPITSNLYNGKFQLKIDSSQLAKNYDLEIYDLQGDKIYASSYKKQQNSNKIDIADIPKGTYFLKLNGGAEIHFKKIVIE